MEGSQSKQMNIIDSNKPQNTISRTAFARACFSENRFPTEKVAGEGHPIPLLQQSAKPDGRQAACQTLGLIDKKATFLEVWLSNKPRRQHLGPLLKTVESQPLSQSC